MAVKYKSFEEFFMAYNNGIETTGITASHTKTDASSDISSHGETVYRNSTECTAMYQHKPEETRDEDDAAEDRFAGFLQRNIYPAFVQKGIADRIERVYDTERQCVGSDAVYYIGGQQIKVDNKNRASVCNRYSRGVPYELYTNNKKGERIVGWGADKGKTTDYILSTHCYIDGSNQKVKFNDISMDDIEHVDMFLYKMDDVRGYFATQGHPIDKLVKEAKQFEREFIGKYKNVRFDKIPDSARRRPVGQHEHLYTSYFKLIEDPTVILIDESVIKKLPNTRHFMWSKEYGLIEIIDKCSRPSLTPSKKN